MKTSIAAIFSALGVFASPTSASLPALPAADRLYIGTVNEAGTFSWLSVPALWADINAAVEALVDACRDTYFSKAIALQRGGVVVYGCLRLRPLPDSAATASRLRRFFKSIGEVCTLGRAGWYQEAERKAIYGYTRAGVGFC